MDKRHLAAVTVASAGCFALSLLVGHLSFFSATAGSQAEAASLGTSSTPAPTPDQPTDRSPEIYQGGVFYSSVSAMLAALHVSVTPQDKVYAFPDPALGIGSVVRVYRAQPVAIADGTALSSARTWAPTVKGLLAERHIDLGDQDTVVPSLSSAIPVGPDTVTVKITRVALTKATLLSSVDFSTTYVDDATMEKGTTSVDTAGVAGVMQKVYQVRRENGVEVGRVLLSSAVTTPPVAKVVRRGTKVIVYGKGLASWYSAPSMTAASTTLAKGTKVLVVNNSNGKSVMVTIADYGPFVAGRIIDLSTDAFAAIANLGSGVASVTLQKVE